MWKAPFREDAQFLHWGNFRPRHRWQTITGPLSPCLTAAAKQRAWLAVVGKVNTVSGVGGSVECVKFSDFRSRIHQVEARRLQTWFDWQRWEFTLCSVSTNRKVMDRQFSLPVSNRFYTLEIGLLVTLIISHNYLMLLIHFYIMPCNKACSDVSGNIERHVGVSVLKNWS